MTAFAYWANQARDGGIDPSPRRSDGRGRLRERGAQGVTCESKLKRESKETTRLTAIIPYPLPTFPHATRPKLEQQEGGHGFFEFVM